MLSIILAKLMQQYVNIYILWKINILTSRSSSKCNDFFRLFFPDKIMPNISRRFIRPHAFIYIVPLLSNAAEISASWQHLFQNLYLFLFYQTYSVTSYLISAILDPPFPMTQPIISFGTVISWVCGKGQQSL
jgi:hypothetical protein